MRDPLTLSLSLSPLLSLGAGVRGTRGRVPGAGGVRGAELRGLRYAGDGVFVLRIHQHRRVTLQLRGLGTSWSHWLGIEAIGLVN